MILNGDWLWKALEKSEAGEFKLLAVDDALVGMKPLEFFAPLIEHNLVFGVGAPTRVRFCKMMVEMEEADRVIGERERGNRRERAASPLDLLRRYCSDRKTTVRKGEFVLRNGRIVYSVRYEHKANAGVRFRSEAERERLARA